MINTPEIVINATEITQCSHGNTYEFVLNDQVQITACHKVVSIVDKTRQPIQNIHTTLQDKLFAFNHVRINSLLDHSHIIRRLIQMLNHAGVIVSHNPSYDGKKRSFKLLEEIIDLRFYVNNKEELIFLSPDRKPQLVYISPSTMVRPFILSS